METVASRAPVPPAPHGLPQAPPPPPPLIPPLETQPTPDPWLIYIQLQRQIFVGLILGEDDCKLMCILSWHSKSSSSWYHWQTTEHITLFCFLDISDINQMCSKMETYSQKLQSLPTFTAPFSDDDPPIMSLRASAILPPAPRPAHNLLKYYY